MVNCGIRVYCARIKPSSVSHSCMKLLAYSVRATQASAVVVLSHDEKSRRPSRASVYAAMPGIYEQEDLRSATEKTAHTHMSRMSSTRPASGSDFLVKMLPPFWRTSFGGRNLCPDCLGLNNQRRMHLYEEAGLRSRRPTGLRGDNGVSDDFSH